MAKIIEQIFMLLAKGLLYTAKFPGQIGVSDQILALVISMVLGIGALILIFHAIRENESSYSFLTRLIVVNIPVLIVAYYSMMIESGLSTGYAMSQPVALALAGVLAGVVLFIVVNYLLEKSKGTVAVLLMVCGLFVVSAALRLWIYANSNYAEPTYGRIMYGAMVSDIIGTIVSRVGLSALLGLVEFFIIMMLMLASNLLIFKARQLMAPEWVMGIISIFLPAVSYLAFACHEGTAWSPMTAFYVFLAAIVGDVLYVFVFCYQVSLKNQDSVIGAFFIFVGAIMIRGAVVLGAEVAKNSLLGVGLGAFVKAMDFLYDLVPVGLKTAFSGGNVFMAILGVAIAVIIALILIILIYLILGKLLDFEGDGAGMGASWFRLCSILLIIPLVILWVGSRYTALFAASYNWVLMCLKALTCIGFASCCANIAPSLFSKGFLGQLKLVLISTIASVFFTCALTAILMKIV